MLSANFTITISNYIVGPVLGRGSKGKVRRGFMKIDSNQWIPVAMKFVFPMSRSRERVPVFNAVGLKELISGWTRVQVEWSLQCMMNHPNISQIIELLWNPMCNVWILIMEFGETLIANYDSKLKMYRQGIAEPKTLNNVPTLSEIGCKNLVKQILNAVTYLHEHQIVHKDLKPENILISSSSLPKEWLKTITPSLDLLDKEETFVETQPYGDGRDWEEMSDCTEEFLWDLDLFEVNSVENYARQINNEIQRYNKCQLCLCCSMENAIKISSTPLDDLKLPMSSHFFTDAAKGEDIKEYQKCLCCSKALHHPLNIVKNLQSDLKICIIDFSSAVQVKEPDFFIYDADGTRQFTPPECIMSLNEEKKISGFARDAWSIGCLLYCLLLGKLPFECDTPVNVYFNIKNGLQKPLPNWLSEDVKDLIMGLLNPNPEERFTLHQCLNHSWFHT
ncbi:uncharacterized protein LOC128882526 isoform X2 [Hylaeus volcanicus]|uniref:uncharacterized protein LOC128882526 isoform X2 n=1 Tax=Hylaeus volcanicus TaxID=313075 RepID=UPI0023B846AC|nr:uncharacterized protein LOC128882526 isoform X2 [Hylaeus volcanicus]